MQVSRARVAAIAVTALFHAALIALFLTSLPKEAPPPPAETETRITFLPLLPPPPVMAKRKRRSGGGSPGSNAITPTFNPYTFQTPSFLQPKLQGLQAALAACLPEKYDMASDEIRSACDRIGALVRHDPGRFGVTQDVTDPTHWQRELARREAPYLAPCMSPNGPDVLYTLYCIYDVLFHGYDSEKQLHYSQ